MTYPDPVLEENHPLAGHTTFEVGGNAGYYAVVSSAEDLPSALGFARSHGLEIFVLGGGSNVLISDEGFPGLVLHMRIKGIAARQVGDHMIVSAGAGEDWPAFVDLCVASGWQGLECLAGIPGTVGAAPVQNIGAYGREVSGSIEGVTTVEKESGRQVYFTRDDCGFGYRRSIFNTCACGSHIITGVDFRLAKNGRPQVTYGELSRALGDKQDISVSTVRDAVIGIRGSKGLLTAGAGGESYKCAGSFFRNPIVPAEEFVLLERRIKEAGAPSSGWAWPLENGGVKVSAACLIELAGFPRGHREGSVGVSPRHTLIIVNYGGAAASEIVAFALKVRGRVLERFGVALEPEARLVGFADNPFDIRLM
jgi:UDP-N-acetylmuramate dehydrogenase